MNLRLFVVSLFAATEALVLPGASSRLVTKPQPKLQVQMSEPDTITSEEIVWPCDVACRRRHHGASLGWAEVPPADSCPREKKEECEDTCTHTPQRTRSIPIG